MTETRTVVEKVVEDRAVRNALSKSYGSWSRVKPPSKGFLRQLEGTLHGFVRDICGAVMISPGTRPVVHRRDEFKKFARIILAKVEDSDISILIDECANGIFRQFPRAITVHGDELRRDLKAIAFRTGQKAVLLLHGFSEATPIANPETVS